MLDFSQNSCIKSIRAQYFCGSALVNSLEVGLENKILSQYMSKSFLNDYYYSFDKRDKINKIIYFNQFANSCHDPNLNSKSSLRKYQYHNTDNQNAKYKGVPLFFDPQKIKANENGVKIYNLGIRTVYHGTTRESVESILHDQCLKPGSNGMFGSGIYFAATPIISKMKCRI